MSSSPKYHGAPLAGERLVLRGEQAALLQNAHLSHDSNITPTESAAAARESARAEGYAAGWAQGGKAARAAVLMHAGRAAERRDREDAERAEALDCAIAALQRAADGLERRIAPAAAEIEQALVHTALAMAEAIIGRELAVATDPGLDAIRRAVRVAPQGQPVRVRLSPSDAAVFTAQAVTVAGREVQVVPDPGIGRGDAIAECGATRIDAGIAAAVQRVREVLGA